MDKLFIAINIAGIAGTIIFVTDSFNMIFNGCTFLLGMCR